MERYAFGLDLAQEFPQPLTDDVVQAADVLITMGCGDACPAYPGKRYLDGGLDDPAGLDVDGVRRVRDDIRARVDGLLAELVGCRPRRSRTVAPCGFSPDRSRG